MVLLFRGNTEAFPGQLGDIIPPAVLSVPWGLLLVGRAPNIEGVQEASGTDARAASAGSSRCGGAAALLYRAPHPISKGPPSHPAEKAHFGRLYPGSCPFMTIDWYIDRHTAEAAPVRLSISRSILPSLVNKTLRYLNSST
ncbi:hypothetical protein PO909_022299 [Leuciscus waleckii]